jgi:hypothetical protein
MLQSSPYFPPTGTFDPGLIDDVSSAKAITQLHVVPNALLALGRSPPHNPLPHRCAGRSA